MLSVIIPTYNEENFIGECIESILKQDYPANNTEILVVDGMSSDRTREIVKCYREKHSNIKLLDNQHRTVPFAMNTGIRNACGEFIIRLDAHAVYPPNYFSELVKYAHIFNTDNIGGVCITDVKHKTNKSWAIKTVLSHKFGVGNSIFRTGALKPQIVDTVPFGCFKRDIFERFGKYDERLVRNQDIELNKRIIKGGGKIMLIPEITCTYFARETFSGIAKNNYKNGYWNILTVYYTKNFQSLSLRHFIPLLFVLSLFLPVLLSVFYFNLFWLALLSLALYTFALLIICISISRHRVWKFFYLFPAFMLLHLSYGIGSIAGIFKILKLKLEGK